MTHWIARLTGCAFALPLLATHSPQVWLAALALVLAVAVLATVVLLRERIAAVPEVGAVTDRRANTSFASAVAVMLVASLFVGCTVGCTAKQKQTAYAIAQQINTYAPTVEAALESTAAAIAALDPTIAAAVMVGVTGFDALSTAFNATLAAYLKDPTASTLANLQAAINAIETNVNVASLNALGIKNSVSQALAQAILKTVLTVATYVFGLIAQTETTAQLHELALTGTIQLTRLRPLMDGDQLRAFAHAEGVPWLLVDVAVDKTFDQAEAAGF